MSQVCCIASDLICTDLEEASKGACFEKLFSRFFFTLCKHRVPMREENILPGQFWKYFSKESDSESDFKGDEANVHDRTVDL